MVKISVDIRQDKVFMRAVQGLIKQKMNELLGKENSLKEIINELILKYVDRRQEQLIENGLRKQLDRVQLILAKGDKYSTRYDRVSLDEYMRVTIQKVVDEIIKKKVSELLKDVKVLVTE